MRRGETPSSHLVWRPALQDGSTESRATVTPSLQPFAAGVAAVYFVPELDVVVFKFPAQKHLAAFAHVGKIHKAPVEVFDLDAARGDVADAFVNRQHRGQEIANGVAANVAAGLDKPAAQALLAFDKPVPGGVDGVEIAAQRAEQPARFLDLKMSFELKWHRAKITPVLAAASLSAAARGARKALHQRRGCGCMARDRRRYDEHVKCPATS